MDNVLESWREFLSGKRRRKDVARFSLRFIQKTLALQDDLRKGIYRHGPYHAFPIHDPKHRDIHKARVRDRLLHHALHRALYTSFERLFIFDSFSCRVNKGTHRAMDRFRSYCCRVSRNNTRTMWVLKCDIKKFFANIDHDVLLSILQKHIRDDRTKGLLQEVISSFHTKSAPGKGLPLGNLTSQLLVNVYMNEFDQYMKRVLRVRHYIRYADDFVILHHQKSYVENLIPAISQYLRDRLKLELHPKKIFTKTMASGVDFLGWVHFPHHRVLRSATRRRMMRRLKESYAPEALQSYLGLLQHGNTWKIQEKIREIIPESLHSPRE